MKRFLYCLLMVILLVSTVSAQSHATLTLSSPTLTVGESGIIEARLDCGTATCSAFDVSIEFDPAYLLIDELILGTYLGDNVMTPQNSIDSKAGEARLAAVVLGSSSTADDDLLFTLEVTALAAGTTRIQLNQIEVGDAQPLVASSRGGTITIVDSAPTETPTPTITPSPTPMVCPGVLPSRLVIGDVAQITPGDPNTLRSAPSLSGARVGRIPAGSRIVVLEGPECADNYAWWRVNHDGIEGWTAEGNNNAYWIEPIESNATAVPVRSVTRSAQAAFQAFERGYMIWLNTSDQIYVLYGDGNWEAFTDTFVEGRMETDSSIHAPNNRYQPRRGFGKVWRENRRVRDGLGWALHIEAAYTATFEYSSVSDDVVISGPNGQAFTLRSSGRWTGG